MWTRRKAALALLAALLAVPTFAAPTTSVVETYDGTIDTASWRVAPFDVIEPTGGSPGAYLHVSSLDSAAPRIFAFPGLDEKFIGDYRAEGVTGLGVDVQLFGTDFALGARPISLYLNSDMGTPDDTSDDCDAVLVGNKNVPKAGTGWKSYDFKVPSQSTALPNGWVLVGTCGSLPAGDAWSYVITHVKQPSFTFGEPDFLYIFQIWDLGFDNPRITSR